MTEYTIVFSRVVHQTIALSTSSFSELDDAIKACKARLRIGGELGTGETWETTNEGEKLRVDLNATLKANMS